MTVRETSVGEIGGAMQQGNTVGLEPSVHRHRHGVEIGENERRTVDGRRRMTRPSQLVLGVFHAQPFEMTAATGKDACFVEHTAEVVVLFERKGSHDFVAEIDAAAAAAMVSGLVVP